MVNEFKLTVVHFARPNPMQSCACAWIYRWTKKLENQDWATGPPGRRATGPSRPWAAGPSRAVGRGPAFSKTRNYAPFNVTLIYLMHNHAILRDIVFGSPQLRAKTLSNS